MTKADIDIVVPTIGRPSLAVLLDALAGQTAPPGRIIVADDRPEPEPVPVPDGLDVTMVASRGRGPAAARNAGWRAGDGEWVAFVDDDVVPPAGWFAALLDDLQGLPDDVAASQGRIRVPLPAGRRPTDWERNVAGLERARWATADMAYRRSVLVAAGGFDERFPRAYREDADLGLRVVRAGYRIETGRRRIDHPVRPAGRWVSVRLQRGNADDVLMRALHGRRWRQDSGAGNGRRRRHLATTAAGLTALAAGAWGRRPLAAAAAALWAAGTAEFASARLAPGPRTVDETITVLLTSAAIPFAATWHTAAGVARLPRLLRRGGPEPVAALVESAGRRPSEPPVPLVGRAASAGRQPSESTVAPAAHARGRGRRRSERPVSIAEFGS